jgi:hypothetical protein
MRIDSSGNVGIGTTSPGARLDIKGLARSSIGTGTGAGGAAYAFYQFGTSATATENWHIGTEGDGSFRFYNQGFGAGLERMRIDASGNFQFNSGYGSVATAFGCRAWVNFNGTGTVAIRASGNVSSITDNAVGSYTVNFTTAMPDANYSVTGAVGPASLGGECVQIQSLATASAAIVTSNNNTGLVDRANVGISVFR